MNAEFRKEVRRIRKVWRWGAIGKVTLRLMLSNAYEHAFGRYPRRYLGTALAVALRG